MVHLELVWLMEERGCHEGRDRVCACQVWEDFVVSMYRGDLCWEQDWVRGVRCVRILLAAAVRGSYVLDFPFALHWGHPGAFLT